MGEPDQRQQFGGPIGTDLGEANVGGGAPAQHDRALEDDGTARLAVPGNAPARRLEQAHGSAQQAGLAGAIGADQHRRGARANAEAQRIEQGAAASGNRYLLETDHPACRSAVRRTIQASALTAITMVISTMPSPIASGRLPLEVSSAIAVVMVRVKPSMLPPTMMTAPTSAAARPKPASSAVTRLKRPSQINVAMRPSGPTFMAASSSWYSLAKSSMVCRASAAMIGAISTVCATIIACGVNRRPQDPSGPERDSRR